MFVRDRSNFIKDETMLFGLFGGVIKLTGLLPKRKTTKSDVFFLFPFVFGPNVVCGAAVVHRML